MHYLRNVHSSLGNNYVISASSILYLLLLTQYKSYRIQKRFSTKRRTMLQSSQLTVQRWQSTTNNKITVYTTTVHCGKICCNLPDNCAVHKVAGWTSGSDKRENIHQNLVIINVHINPYVHLINTLCTLYGSLPVKQKSYRLHPGREQKSQYIGMGEQGHCAHFCELRLNPNISHQHITSGHSQYYLRFLSKSITGHVILLQSFGTFIHFHLSVTQ